MEIREKIDIARVRDTRESLDGVQRYELIDEISIRHRPLRDVSLAPPIEPVPDA
jgi:hypothetical protein